MSTGRPPQGRGLDACSSGGNASAGRSGSLWTCRGCHRNNEARVDACYHCRSCAPPRNTNQGSTFATNPYERFIRGGSNSTTGNPGGVSRRSGLALPTSARSQGQTASRTANMVRGASTNAGQGCHVRSGNAVGGTSRCKSSTFSAPARRPRRLVLIDPEAAGTWIYPVNYPVRKYQQQIVTAALFSNTLVALPTGLGKTLIAAVVMYNFYRWFPEGKVVFLAPTKPLVAQQISACYDIMGVAEKDTAELQGSVAPEKRRELWRERRVFFCTPQSMVNDIKQKRCDPGRFVCVVVDEAHRGTGNYAYVNVIREVAAATPYFRVLALSATPGSDTKAIQQVLVNLRISHIECRSEDDPEVAKHTHARQIEVVRCKLGDHMDAIRQNLVAVLQPLVSRMANKRVLFTRDPMALKAWGVLEALKTFRRTAHDRGGAHLAGEVESEMAILTKVVQAKEVLLTHGAAGCLNKLANMEDEVRRRGFRSNAERGVMQHEAWGDLMKLLRQTAENTAGLSTKHPKLIKLREVLREHFGRHQAAGKSTRAIVFTQWRDSVEEITNFLADDHLLRVKAFIGQGNSSGAKARAATEAARVKAAHCRGGDGGGATEADADEDGRSDGGDPLAAKPRLKGQTQKEQKAVVKAFFAGEFNCLVATCIGEEGLDIGEVDLIVSFDALSSPVRMVQRMGRTGRKRAGKVVVLVTEGAEESKLRNSNSKSKSITKTLQTRKDKFDMFQRDDPMVPPGPRPRMVEQEMIIDEYHLSQVGGHQKKVSRKGGGGAGGGAGAGASAPRDDWRLTAEQKATLAEAYSDEPGTERYVPDAVSGWKRQKNPWATGTVARSARSRLLCEIKDFVAHQEWELLYDPVDMQLILATLRDEEKVSPGSRESGRGTHNAPSRCGGDAGDGGGGNGSAHPAPSSDSDNDDFETHPKRRNDKRPGKLQLLHDGSIDDDERGGGVKGNGDNVIAASAATATNAAAKRSTCNSRKGARGKGSADARGGKAGDGVGRVEPCAQKPDANADNHEARNGIGRGISSRDAAGGEGVEIREGADDASAVPRGDLGCQNPRGKMTTGTPSAVTLVRRATATAGTRKAQASVAQEAKAAPIAARGGQPAESCTQGVQGEVDVVGQERSQACRREWTDVGGSGSMNDPPGGEGGENDNDDEETQSDPEFRSSGVLLGRAQNGGPSTIGRWRCDCGCLVKPGRFSCRVCGGTIMASAGDAGASSPSSTCKSPSPSVSVLEPKQDGGERLSLPDQTCVGGKTSSSLKVSSSGLFDHSADGGHPTGGSQASRNTTGSGSNGMQADSRSDASSRSQAGRWQCGCGCRIRVGRKRCVMCGQPKPSEGSGEAGVSSGVSVAHRKHPDGGLVYGDERVTPHRAEAGSARGGHSGSSSGSRSSEMSAVDGSWQCSGCGNEYVATRTKCRSCGTPKPSTEARAAPDDQTAPPLTSSGCNADRPDDGGGTEPGFIVEASCPGQPQVCADRTGDAALEAFAGEEHVSSVHSRVRDLSAGRDRAVPLAAGRWRGKRSRSSSAALVGNDAREDAPFVAKKRPPEDLAATPAVGSGSNGSDRDHVRSGSASETPSSRNIGLEIDDLRSPRTDASSQSQDDGLAELFPSLHRFEAGESAAAGGGCRATSRGARPSLANSSGCAAAVRIADSFAALPSPLVAPPPSLCVSLPPLPFIGKPPTCLTGPTGASARSAQGSDGNISMLPSQSLVRSRSHEAVIRGHTAASSPSSRARIDLAVSTDGGAVRSTEEVPGFYDGAIVGTSGRSGGGGGGGDPSTRSDSPHGAAPKIGDVPPTEVAFTEESVASVAGAACVSATIPSTVERTSADCVRVTTSSSSATAAGERDGRIESRADEKREEELVSDRAPLLPACASDGESVNNSVEVGNTRRGATEREVQVEAVATGGGDPGRPRKNVGGEENRRDDDDDLACGVCGSTASEEEDPIILCEGLRCQTAVHAGCYGVVKVPEGQWLCDPCSEVSKEAAQRGGKGDGGDEGCNYGSLQPCCELCTHKGGALKRSRCGRWVHLVCVWWTPELSTEPDTVRPRPLTELDPGRVDLTCSACHRRGGAAVRCAANRCVEACHPFCAMRAGQILAEENGVFELFCKLHSRQLERRNDKEEGGEPEGKLERCASTRVEGKAEAEAGTKASGDDDCDADVFMGATTTPRGRKGARESAPGDTASTCVSTPSSDAARDGAPDGGGSNLCRGETRGEPWEEEYGGVLPAGTEMTQGPIPPRRHPAGSRAEKSRKKRALLDLEDDDDDGEDEGIDADSVVMSGGRGIAAMTEGWRDSAGGGVTPPKIFDMAPPREKQPRPPPTGGVDECASRRARGTATASTTTTNATTNKRRPCLALPSPVPSSLSRRQQQQQPDGRRISPTEKGEACSPGGGVDHEGGEGGLMTLSQAVSPAEEDRQGKGKRRRLRKYESPGKSSEIGGGCAKNNADEDLRASALASKARAATKERRSGGGERLKRGARECDYDKAAYRRFIDHEAEVDEDLSDDDEAAILDEYDSEDSFVNDGPLSYETCFSQEEGTPSRSRETSVDGDDDDVARRRAKRRRGGIEDEKGMYLQLLAESPSPNPYVRGSGDVVGSSGRRRSGRRRCTGRGGGSDRFAFINAVMAHARDGGDPLDIEEACRSNGFTQEGYAGTPKTTSPSQDGANTATESSGGSGVWSGRQASRSGGGRDAQPMYSQVLRQAAHPKSPSSPQARDDVSPVPGKPAPGETGKENAPCATASADERTSLIGSDAGDLGWKKGERRDSTVDDDITKGRSDGDAAGATTPGVGGAEALPLGRRNANCALGDRAAPADRSKEAVGDPSAASSGDGFSRGARLGADTAAAVVASTGAARVGGVAIGIGGDHGEAGSKGNGKGASLTDRQRQIMLENREKALARLKQRQHQQQAAAAAKAGVGRPVGAIVAAPEAAAGTQQVRKTVQVNPSGGGASSWSLAEVKQSLTGATQRERFRMTLDMESDDDSDVENSTGRDVSPQPPPTALAASSSSLSSSSTTSTVAVENAIRDTTRGASKSPTTALGEAADALQRSGSLSRRSLPSSIAPSTPPPTKPPASASRLEASLTTLPLSAPRASDLESLAAELRSRESFAVHATPLGGGSRDVDLAVGSQCAVCVRSVRQFLAQTQVTSGGGNPAFVGAGESARVPLVMLLEAGLQRYARITVIVEGLGGEQQRLEAVDKVEALRGASVVASSGWRETADKVVALVEQEAASGYGLPAEVNGPSLNTAQEKFLAFLLRAPTLSYPGGLYLLQAFRGRSGKEMIASSAKELQSAVPGMTARQAAMLKRFLASGGRGVSSGAARPIASRAAAVGAEAKRQGGLSASASQRARS